MLKQIAIYFYFFIERKDSNSLYPTHFFGKYPWRTKKNMDLIFLLQHHFNSPLPLCSVARDTIRPAVLRRSSFHQESFM